MNNMVKTGVASLGRAEITAKIILMSITTLLYLCVDKYAYRFWAHMTILEYPENVRKFMWRSTSIVALIVVWILVFKYVAIYP